MIATSGSGDARRGLLIAFFGLPGSGKSTTCQSLANMIPNAQAYLEPEESQWPEAVLNRNEFGKFTAITWFRSMRVPLLYKAYKARNAGMVSIVDSYYDKLISQFIEFPAMGWLLPTDDSYFGVAKQLFDLDSQILPDADCLIFLRIAEEDWRTLVRRRGRAMDAEEDFLKGYPSQEIFLEAAQTFAHRTSARLIIHEQKVGTPDATARAILNSMVDAGVVVPNG